MMIATVPIWLRVVLYGALAAVIMLLAEWHLRG